MKGDVPFGGGVFIADTSAWQRTSLPAVADEWVAALRAGQVATCAPVMIEVLYTTRNPDEFDEVESRLRGIREIPITRTVTQAAIRAMRELARMRPLHHRVPLPDLLVAAAAQEAGVGVLHCDRHYDRLAEVLDFESRWLVPPGSVS